MSICMICLENSNRCQLRGVCGNNNCTIRIHNCCYYQWYFDESYSDRCPCGKYVNTYRFGLPPVSGSLDRTCSSITMEHNLQPGEAIVNGSNRWSYTKYIPCNWFRLPRFRIITGMVVYWLVAFIVLGYIGKLYFYQLSKHHIEFWTFTGFVYHFAGFILSFWFVILLRVLCQVCRDFQWTESSIDNENPATISHHTLSIVQTTPSPTVHV